MSNFMSHFLVPAAIVAVAIVLLLGRINMMRGGSPNRSQKLMRLRVLLQFVAIIGTMALSGSSPLVGEDTERALTSLERRAYTPLFLSSAFWTSFWRGLVGRGGLGGMHACSASLCGRGGRQSQESGYNRNRQYTHERHPFLRKRLR